MHFLCTENNTRCNLLTRGKFVKMRQTMSCSKCVENTEMYTKKSWSPTSHAKYWEFVSFLFASSSNFNFVPPAHLNDRKIIIDSAIGQVMPFIACHKTSIKNTQMQYYEFPDNHSELISHLAGPMGSICRIRLSTALVIHSRALLEKNSSIRGKTLKQCPSL